jgi:hypothetical protein
VNTFNRAKNTILDKCNDVISSLDDNQLAEKEEFESQQKELESVCNAIMTKMNCDMTGGMPGGSQGAGGTTTDGGDAPETKRLQNDPPGKQIRGEHHKEFPDAGDGRTGENKRGKQLY